MRPGVLPDFRLPARGGGEFSLEGLRQRQETILAVLFDGESSESFELLRALARQIRSSGVEGAAVAALARLRAASRADGLDLPFPMLEDGSGRVQRAILRAAGLEADGAALITSDRYGTVIDARVLLPGSANAALEEALAAIRFVQIQCPECGVPTW